MILVYVILATEGSWIAIGATLAIIVLVGGKISGGAYNPAVAISLNASGKLEESDVLPYIIAEVVGGLAAINVIKNLQKHLIKLIISFYNI